MKFITLEGRKLALSRERSVRGIPSLELVDENGSISLIQASQIPPESIMSTQIIHLDRIEDFPSRPAGWLEKLREDRLRADFKRGAKRRKDKRKEWYEDGEGSDEEEADSAEGESRSRSKKRRGGGAKSPRAPRGPRSKKDPRTDLCQLLLKKLRLAESKGDRTSAERYRGLLREAGLEGI